MIIRYYLFIQFILMAILSSTISVIDRQQSGISFFIGALLATLNVAVFVWVVSRLFNKKPIATSVVIILFKYTFFGLFIYYAVNQDFFVMAWFLVGLAVLFPSLIGFVYLHMKHMKEEENKLNQFRK